MKSIVVINESHQLFPEQMRLLQERYDKIEYLKVPSEGWDRNKIESVTYDLIQNSKGFTQDIVVVSPIPLMLRDLSANSINSYNILIFHNDKRCKKELPNGKIIQVVSETGWELI
jgi:hypothetical protein